MCPFARGSEILEFAFELSTDDHSRSLRLRAVGMGDAGEGCELLAADPDEKKFGRRRPEASFLFLLKVILRSSSVEIIAMYSVGHTEDEARLPRDHQPARSERNLG